MIAALSSATATVTNSPTALGVVLIAAIAALIAIGVIVRRLRTHGGLTLTRVSISAAAASFVVAATLLTATTIGEPAQASATPAVSSPTAQHTGPVDSTPAGTIELDGFQLPTE